MGLPGGLELRFPPPGEFYGNALGACHQEPRAKMRDNQE